MSKKETPEQARFRVSQIERQHVWSSFAIRYAIDRNTPQLVESIQKLSADQMDQLVIAAAKVIEHTTAELAIKRKELAKHGVDMVNHNRYLLLRIDELKRKLHDDYGVDIDSLADKRERA